MIEAPYPSNEDQRLAAVRSYELLDTPPEEVFDDLTRVAARVCGTPIALVSLIDEDRQWFKSRFGLEAKQTPRKYAFCSHAILEPEKTLVVEDATQDERFHDNPLVTGPPHVLFYAGAPLVTPEGLPLGTLCVIDHTPRTIDEDALETLRSLARSTVTQMELHRTCRDLRDTSVGLVKANQALEHRNDEIRRFYQTLSHELKTPLTITRDYVSMVLEGLVGEVRPEQREFLAIGVDNCDRLARSVDDLLDLTRIETCKFRMQARAVPVRDLVEAATDGMAPFAERGKVRLSWSADDDLPPVRADADRLIQVINNLVRNAIKFTPAGGSIRLSARRSPERPDLVEFAVSDTGCGISADDLDRIFDRLYQCRDADSSSLKGLGLGLHLSREIVKLHGGDITAESTPGRGTTFRFRIPTEPSDPSPQPSEAAPELSEETTP